MNRELEEMSKGENIVKMDKWAKDKLVSSPGENGGGQDAQKRCSLEKWKGRDEGEDPGKDGKRKQTEIFM